MKPRIIYVFEIIFFKLRKNVNLHFLFYYIIITTYTELIRKENLVKIKENNISLGIKQNIEKLTWYFLF
jgi:hypothetical protein